MKYLLLIIFFISACCITEEEIPELLQEEIFTVYAGPDTLLFVKTGSTWIREEGRVAITLQGKNDLYSCSIEAEDKDTGNGKYTRYNMYISGISNETRYVGAIPFLNQEWIFNNDDRFITTAVGKFASGDSIGIRVELDIDIEL
jgi:hypothetical protein